MSSTKLSDSIKTILITGGTGLVGMELSNILSSKGFEVTHLSRNPTKKGYRSFYWNVKKNEIDEEAIKSADAIIHLAGAGVADKRWNEAWKKEIYDSRIQSTRLLKEKVKEFNPDLKYFLSASAIGIYGWDTGEELIDETQVKGDGFLADVVEDWEKEVDGFTELNIPHGKVRIGIVLSEKGGALVEMMKPIRFGAGAALGSGKQYMSWIHIDDLVGIINHMLIHQLTEAFNGVAPNPATNADFTKSVGRQIRRPILLPNVPKFALKLIVGEMADILVGGNRVSSQKIENSGYKFRFPTLDKALQDLLQ